MSERCSFVTEYVNCGECFERLKSAMLQERKEFTGRVIEPFPIIAGRLSGFAPEDAYLELFSSFFDNKDKAPCHPVRIAVLHDNKTGSVYIVYGGIVEKLSSSGVCEYRNFVDTIEYGIKECELDTARSMLYGLFSEGIIQENSRAKISYTYARESKHKVVDDIMVSQRLCSMERERLEQITGWPIRLAFALDSVRVASPFSNYVLVFGENDAGAFLVDRLGGTCIAYEEWARSKK